MEVEFYKWGCWPRAHHQHGKFIVLQIIFNLIFYSSQVKQEFTDFPSGVRKSVKEALASSFGHNFKNDDEASEEVKTATCNHAIALVQDLNFTHAKNEMVWFFIFFSFFVDIFRNCKIICRAKSYSVSVISLSNMWYTKLATSVIQLKSHHCLKSDKISPRTSRSQPTLLHTLFSRYLIQIYCHNI